MNQETAQLLQQIGIEKSDLSWTTQVVLILAILLVSYLTTLIFRHLIMPAVRKITARTKATWTTICSMTNDESLLPDDSTYHLVHPAPFCL